MKLTRKHGWRQFAKGGPELSQNGSTAISVYQSDCVVQTLFGMLLFIACALVPAYAVHSELSALPMPIGGDKPLLPVQDVRALAKLQDELTLNRLETVLPALMRKHGIDVWLLLSHEYREDAVLKTMLPADWFHARRLTVLLFHDQGAPRGIERIALSRYDIDELFKKGWDSQQHPDVWAALQAKLTAWQPKKIGIAQSAMFAHADSVTTREWALLQQHLPQDFKAKLTNADGLALDYLQTRSHVELALYPQIAALSHQYIATLFSNQVITPGQTTIADAIWWLRQQLAQTGLLTWFQPSIRLQRQGQPMTEAAETVIVPGDLLHVDFGIVYAGLMTDQQQHAYVLKPGETDAPEEFKTALAKGNQLQDIVSTTFQTGRTGNELLAISRAKAIKQGLVPRIYSHPIGLHGHGAGPTIGLWDAQQGEPGRGDLPILANTAYSIELSVKVDLPSWGSSVDIMLEENGWFDGKTFHYFAPRQQQLHLIAPANGPQQ